MLYKELTEQCTHFSLQLNFNLKLDVIFLSSVAFLVINTETSSLLSLDKKS